MNVALALWNEVDLLSFSGPGQLFARAGEGGAFFVYTVAETRHPITTEDFLTVVPEFTIQESPRPDVLVVPGGGVYYVAHRKALLGWLAEAAQAARIVLATADALPILRAAGVPGVPDPLERSGNYTVADGADDGGDAAIGSVVEQGKFVVSTTASAVVEATRRVISRLGGERLACNAIRCCGSRP